MPINNTTLNDITFTTGTIPNDYGSLTTLGTGTYTITIDNTAPFFSTIDCTAPSFTYDNSQPTSSSATLETSKQKKMEPINPYPEKISENIKKQKAFSNVYFINIKEYVPNKVYEFVIALNKGKEIVKIKTICDESDEFDFDFAFYLAIAKATSPGMFTPEGYVRYAKELSYQKIFIKSVKYGKKLFTLIQERDKWEEEQEELKKNRHQRYIEKKKARDKRKKEQEDYRLKEVIQKAIKGD